MGELDWKPQINLLKPKQIAIFLTAFTITLAVLSPVFTFFSVSAESWTDNTNEDFSQGIHENTENIDNTVRLVVNYTQGRFTSRVFDAGENVDWDNIVWSESEPTLFKQENDNVGVEENLSNSTILDGSINNLRQSDDIYENIAENSDNRLLIVHVVENVATGFDNYAVKVEGRTSGENIGVYAWDNQAGSWKFIENLTSIEKIITFIIPSENIENYLVGDNIRIKYEDYGTDSIQDNLYVDLCIVKENVTYTSEIKIQVRVSADGLTWTDNLGPDGTSNTYFTISPASLENIPDNRYIRYVAYFLSGNTELSGENGPILHEVNIFYAPPIWQIFEKWSGVVSAPAAWQTIDSWTGTVGGYIWHIVETWAGTVETPIYQYVVESWEGTVGSMVPDEYVMEGWSGTINALTRWYAVETWVGAVMSPAQWYTIERWDGTLGWTPGQPQLHKPEDGATTDNTPLFQWIVMGGVDNYRLEVATDNSFAPSTIVDTVVLGPADNWWQKGFPGYTPNENYYWRVVAINKWGENASENWRTFLVTIPPSEAVLVSPDNDENVGQKVTLRWRLGKHADNHRIEIDNDGDWTNVIENVTLGPLANQYTTVLPYGTYRWRVWTINLLSENESENTWYFNIVAIWNAYEVWRGTINAPIQWHLAEHWVGRISSPPAPPILISPEDNARVISTPTFWWESGGGLLENFRLEVSKDPGFLFIIDSIWFDNLTSSWTKPAPGYADDNYYWRVWAVIQAREAVSVTWTFEALREFTPRRPVLISPENGESVVYPIILEWKVGERAENHRIEIDNDDNFANGVIENVYIPMPDNKYVADLLYGTYFWRVWAVNAWGENRSENTWQFMIVSVPGVVEVWTGTIGSVPSAWRLMEMWSGTIETIVQWKIVESWSGILKPCVRSPIQISPADGAALYDNTPLLDWDIGFENSAPLIFYVEISSDKYEIVENVWVSADYWEVTSPLADNLYYWRVFTIDNTGESSTYFTWWRFWIDQVVPSQPTPYSPENNAFLDGLTITFKWGHANDPSPGSGVENYIILIDDEPSFDNAYYMHENKNVAGNVYTYTFANSGIYYWRVRAVDKAGNLGDWSQIFTFRNCAWGAVESWTVVVKAITPWQVTESWSGKVRAPPTIGWRVVESWPGAITAPPVVGRYLIETWAGSIGSFVPVWQQIEIWTGMPRATVLPPMLSSPADDTNTNNPNVIFKWEEVWLADDYRIQIDDEPPQPIQEIKVVDSEPSQLVDGTARKGSLIDGSISDVNTADDVYEIIGEKIKIIWENCYYVENQWVNEGESTGFDNMKQDDGIYENLCEKGYEENYLSVKSPSSIEAIAWTNPTGAFTDGEGNAHTAWGGHSQTYRGYGFNLPTEARINSVRVRLDAWCRRNDMITLEISIDGGSSYLPTRATLSLTTTETTHWQDVTGWTSWSPAFLNNDQIWVRVTMTKIGLPEEVYLDWIPIEVSYTVDYYRMDIQQTITGAPIADRHTLQIKYFITDNTDENFTVYLENLANPGEWDNVGDLHSTASTVFTHDLTGTDYLSDGKVHVRYVQSDNDYAKTSLMIDYVRVRSDNLDFALRWEHRIDNVPTNRDNYLVRIRGYTDGDDENIGVYLWNNTDSRWEFLDNLSILGAKVVTKFIWREDLARYLRNGSVSIKYEDWDNLDATQTIIHIDLCVIEKNIGFPLPLVLDDVTTKNDYAITLQREAVYWWKVRATAKNAVGEWSDVWTLRLDMSDPTSPALILPENGENTNDNTVFLAWYVVPENSHPIKYEVQIATDAGFKKVAQTENLLGTQGMDNVCWETPALEDHFYYWRVRAWDNAGNVGNWSEVGNFRVDTVAPAPPILLFPENGARVNDSTPMVVWEFVKEVSLPVVYELQVDDMPAFRWPEVNISLTDNHHTTRKLTDEMWYWRVRAIDNAGNIGEYKRFWFVVDTAAPPQPTLESPAHESAINDATPSFDWWGVADPSGLTYTLEIIGKFTKQGLTRSEYTLAENEALSEGTYLWRVCAIDNAGNEGEWTENFKLTIDFTLPELEVLEPVQKIVQENVVVQVEVSDPSGIDTGSISVILDNEGVDYSWIDNAIVIELEELDEGLRKIDIRLRDKAANENFLSIEVKVIKENIRIELLAPTRMVMVEENFVTVALSFRNMTENSISRTFEIILAGRRENLLVELRPEEENTFTTRINIRGLSPDNYQLFAIDWETGQLIEIGIIEVNTLRMAPPPIHPIWLLLSIIAVGIGIGSGTIIWKTKRPPRKGVPEVSEFETRPLFVERETLLPTEETPLFSIPGEAVVPDEYRAYLLRPEVTPPTLEKEWSRLMDRYKEEISPLMVEYRELLKPEEAMVAPARPEESRLMEEYRALVKKAAHESKTVKRTGHGPEKMKKGKRKKSSKRRAIT